MRTLELDFANSSSRAWNRGNGILALGAVAIAILFGYQLSLMATLTQIETDRDLIIAEGDFDEDANFESRRDYIEERAVATDLARQLQRPWDELFAALERARADPVVLTGLEVDSQSGRLELVGTAPALSDVGAFIKALEATPVLTQVTIINHEQRNVPEVSILFTIGASWK